MNIFLDEPVYVLVMRKGLKEEDIDNESSERIIMSIYSTEEDAIKVKENEERRTRNFEMCYKYYVECWHVHAPNIKFKNEVNN